MDHPTTGPQETTAPGEEPGRADDYIDVYISPKQVFDRRRDGRWVQAFIVLSAILVALYYAFLPATEIIAETELARVLAENPEQAQAADQMAGFGRTMRLIGGIFVPIGTVLAIVIVGALIWGLGAMLGAAVSFRQALVITTFARFVDIPRTIATSVSVLWADRVGEVVVARDTSFGPLRFVDTAALHDVAVPLLGRLDVFVLWQAALWAIGLYVISRAGKDAALLIAAIALVLAALPGIVMALVRGL
jgi:hypothetical protein